jgi:hypothetical protein
MWKNLDAVGDAVFDEHALRVSPDEVHGRATQLVGQYEGGFLRAPDRSRGFAEWVPRNPAA